MIKTVYRNSQRHITSEHPTQNTTSSVSASNICANTRCSPATALCMVCAYELQCADTVCASFSDRMHADRSQPQGTVMHLLNQSTLWHVEYHSPHWTNRIPQSLPPVSHQETGMRVSMFLCVRSPHNLSRGVSCGFSSKYGNYDKQLFVLLPHE